MDNYIDLKPFKFWCQKVLPLVYDDSLSYYELLCKVVDYLNKTMTDVTVLHDEFVQLQEWVNDYFDNLDVQNEINNKLDKMAEDGTLSKLLEPYLNEFNTKISKQDESIAVLNSRVDNLSKLPDGSTDAPMQIPEIPKTMMLITGLVVPTAARASLPIKRPTIIESTALYVS